jgi:hypothetical protein
MLGRLRMGIQETIDAYLQLAARVFKERSSSIKHPKWVGALLGRARFDGEALAQTIKVMVEEKTGSEDTIMFDSRPDACRVYVYLKYARHKPKLICPVLYVRHERPTQSQPCCDHT